MENETRHDLDISGAGSASGGVFGVVRINGAGTVNGDIDCLELTINGALTSNGNIKAQTCIVRGSLSAHGNVDAESIKVAGSASVDGIVSGKEFKVDGSADINGSVKVEEAKVRGSIKVKNDCEAEAFDLDGGFTIGGLLNAGTVEIKMYAACRAREIGGESIDVRRDELTVTRILKSLFTPPFLQNSLTVETVEGDSVYLEYTKANVVRGNSVNIGAGCEIDLVEYKESLQQAPDATVKEARKTEVVS